MTVWTIADGRACSMDESYVYSSVERNDSTNLLFRTHDSNVKKKKTYRNTNIMYRYNTMYVIIYCCYTLRPKRIQVYEMDRLRAQITDFCIMVYCVYCGPGDVQRCVGER